MSELLGGGGDELSSGVGVLLLGGGGLRAGGGLGVDEGDCSGGTCVAGCDKATTVSAAGGVGVGACVPGSVGLDGVTGLGFGSDFGSGDGDGDGDAGGKLSTG